MPVQSVHRLLRISNRLYTIVKDCIEGEIQIKFRRDKYLPRPNPEDLSEENRTRYEAYLTRAVFYNVTRRTLMGLMGQVYAREPQIDVPTLLDPVKNDATGLGVPLVQLSKQATMDVIAYGRCGVFCDYPNTDTPATRAQLQNGDIRPVITIHHPWDCINWRVIPKDSKRILSLVVLQEYYPRIIDEFEEVAGTQWRVLSLNNDGVYRHRLYQDRAGPIPVIDTIPLDATGKPFDTIPFSFIGSDNNDPNPDHPPMYDLASLNVAHYRNSADYEESCYLVGQPTPFFAGLTEHWVNSVLKGKVQLGSRAAVSLPQGGTAGLLQASPNQLPLGAMDQKEKQMVALGAKLIQERQIQRTATEANIDYVHEQSTLSAAADNVSDAFTFALSFAAAFVGEQPLAERTQDQTGDNKVVFQLNTEFDLLRLSPQERQALVLEWQQGLVTFTEIRANLRRAGIATEDDATARTQIKEDAALRQSLQPQPTLPTLPNAPLPGKGGNNQPAASGQ